MSAAPNAEGAAGPAGPVAISGCGRDGFLLAGRRAICYLDTEQPKDSSSTKKDRMAFDPYSPCPCGSGKKFKWCCQPIHVDIDKAFRQEAEGQHEAALRTMQEVVRDHAGNPEAWGRYAQLLYQNGKVNEAEEAIQKAFAINPDYPFGFLLRGMFRQHEGELAGALLLFRQAAERYDPEARDILGQVYALMAECHLQLNRPVAARAALRLAHRCQPGNEELRQALDDMAGGKSSLPASARKDYTFLSPPAEAPAERRLAWDHALAGAATGKLSDAVAAFERLTETDANDAAAWFNLGLARAWLGDNRAAVEALDRAVAAENDPLRAAEFWSLAEVLRLGHGMEEQSDYVEHSYLFPIANPELVVSALQQLQQNRRLVVLPSRDEEQQMGVVTALLVEPPSALAVRDPSRPELARLQATLLIIGDRLRIWNIPRDSVEKAREELQKLAGPGLGPPHADRACAPFVQVLAETVVLPISGQSAEAVQQAVRDDIQKYFEEVWIHKPLRSLAGTPPVDAAGHGVLKKKLLGVIRFLEDCAQVAGRPYDFDRLRRKLGLTPGAPGGPATAAAGPDWSALSAAELADLAIDSLADDQLEQAYQAALKLDAQELAGRFAQAVVARPPHGDRPDRFPYYFQLIQLAQSQGDFDRALGQIDEGLKADCQYNDGRRRNDYELRRGQLLARRGDAEAAQEVFDRLIERAPADLKFQGAAAEAMLAAHQLDRALHFAQQGLAKAREKNDRDSEGYFLELTEAASRHKS
jgi:tetratricopeptide (TPR) repeat protein